MINDVIFCEDINCPHNMARHISWQHECAIHSTCKTVNCKTRVDLGYYKPTPQQKEKGSNVWEQDKDPL